MDIELLEFRAGVFGAVRAFFGEHGFLETDTPVLAPDLIPETCLEVFETAWLPPAGSRKDRAEKLWLVPSPELWMKRLIARHRRNIFQICKCFRNTESSGKLHSPEFTMLEYYTMKADWLDSLALTEELFLHIAGKLRRHPSPYSPDAERLASLMPPFPRLSVAEAFARYAGIADLYAALEPGGLEDGARRLGLDPPDGLGVQALYDLIFVHAVEPNLPKEKPVVLMDYPAFVPCLAKTGGGGRTRERWELYIRGVELANCFSEETDAGTVRAYFDAEGAAKTAEALVPHRLDGDYWKIFLPDRAGRPFPECSGVAMGLDRLLMVLSGRSSIDAVLPFPMSVQSAR